MSKEMDMELDFDKLEQVSGGGQLQDLTLFLHPWL